MKRPAWATTPAKLPARARDLATRAGHSARVKVVTSTPIIDGQGLQRHLEITTPQGTYRAMETITAMTYSYSIQPRSPMSAQLILGFALQFGPPTLIYADDVGNAHDYTAEWHAQAQNVHATSLRAGLRTAAGMRANALTLDDLIQKATA